MKIVEGIMGFLFGLAIWAMLSVALALPTKWTVNYLFSPDALTAMFGMAQLTLGKAWALNFVAASLFKGSTTTKSTSN
jgi:hypothetical protein